MKNTLDTKRTGHTSRSKCPLTYCANASENKMAGLNISFIQRFHCTTHAPPILTVQARLVSDGGHHRLWGGEEVVHGVGGVSEHYLVIAL